MRKIIFLFIVLCSFLTAKSVTAPLLISNYKTKKLNISDTIITNKGFTIYVGQKLIVGKGTGLNGRYVAIGFKTPVNFTNLFLRETDIAHNPEYKLDPSAREKDKVKESLVIGSIVTINKLIINGNNKKGHSYVIYFKGDDTNSNNYRSFIDEAIPMGELSFQ